MGRKILFVVFVSIIVAVSAQTLADNTGDNQGPVKTCTTANGTGECVPYYLCNNGKVNTDGENVIDIRFDAEKECIEYFEECCGVEQVLVRYS